MPVNLISSVALTNLNMTVEVRPDRLTNLWIEPILTQQVCSATIVPAATPSPGPLPGQGGAGAFYNLALATCTSQFPTGALQVAWLHFTTTTNGNSAFVALGLDNIVGLQPNGTPVRNFAPQSGRVVIIGEEPLLEAFIATNRQPTLMLYGKWPYDYVVETATDVRGPWTTNQSTTLTTNLWTPLTVPANRPQQFYRARRQ